MDTIKSNPDLNKYIRITKRGLFKVSVPVAEYITYNNLCNTRQEALADIERVIAESKALNANNGD